MIPSEDQRPFRQIFHPSCIGHTIDFSFVGMNDLSPARRGSAAPPQPPPRRLAPQPDIFALLYVRRSEFIGPN